MNFSDKLARKIIENKIHRYWVWTLSLNIPTPIKRKAFDEYSCFEQAAAHSIAEFNKRLIDAVCDIIPAVKPQLAYYEMYGIHGIWVFNETVKYAKSKDLIVIADGKRNDIGSTSEAYASAYPAKQI